MRILHVLSQEVLTGAEVYAATVVENQVKAGHQVFAISPRFHTEFKCQTFTCPTSSSKISDRIASIHFLRKFIKEHQIEVIHVHARSSNRNVYWARKGLKVAVVSTVHGRQHFSFHKRLLDIYGDVVIANCENVKTHLINDFKMSARKIRVIGNPVDGIRFKAFTKERPQKIAIVGRSAGPKGGKTKEICRHVLFPLLQKNKNLELTILASEPKRFGDDFLSELSSNPQITLLEQQGKLAAVYNEQRLVIGAGRVAIEAMFCESHVLALGEHDCHGIVTSKNWNECLASNFGDIGATSVSPVIDWQKISNELSEFLTSQLLDYEVFKKARETFLSEKVCDNIIEAYREAIWKVHVKKWIPILMYHKVPNTPLETKHRIFVTKENFEKHILFFQNQGFHTLHFRDLKKFWSGEKPFSEFPKKPLILTFDDGYLDNLENALPILESHHTKATCFLLANHSIVENTWDAKDEKTPSKLMSLEEKQKFALSPLIEIGSHGFNHVHLTEASQDEIIKETKDSKRALEKDLNTDICSFAYPFGSVNENTWKFAKAAGYDFAVNTDQGGLSLEENRWSLFRVNIFPEETRFTLWKKTRPQYRKYFYSKRRR